MSAPDTTATFPYEPTQDERTFATLAHALQMVGWWIAPLVIFIVKRQSKFVSFHALQALLLQIVWLMFWIAFMMVWFGAIFSVVLRQPPPTQPPAALFLLMPFIWLVWMGAWATILIIVILYSIKAGRGEWANYPLLGRLARRILHLKR